MKIKVLEIVEKEAFLIKAFELSDYHDFYINRNFIDNKAKKHEIIFKNTDSIEILPRQKEIIGYKKDDSFLSVEQYKSKPTYFDSDSSEEETLRAIANRKEIEGFEPVFKEIDFEKVEIEVFGFIEDTKSSFIKCAITGNYQSPPNVYTLSENAVAVDEYKKLKNKYSTHARFDDLDRSYIQYAQINGNYLFSNGTMFSEKRNEKVFLSLEEATKAEKEIRDQVSRIVKNKVFPQKIDANKKIIILNHLKAIKKAKSKTVMDEMLQILIEDIQDYKKEVELLK